MGDDLPPFHKQIYPKQLLDKAQTFLIQNHSVPPNELESLEARRLKSYKARKPEGLEAKNNSSHQAFSLTSFLASQHSDPFCTFLLNT
jgi:hypothetical protein